LLQDLLDKVGNPDQAAWKSFVTNGIGIDSGRQEIQQFVDNFGQSHAMCGQCPTGAQGQLLHKFTVKQK
jgi:hypothetical protein